jgi:hypothetical protein
LIGRSGQYEYSLEEARKKASACAQQANGFEEQAKTQEASMAVSISFIRVGDA